MVSKVNEEFVAYNNKFEPCKKDHDKIPHTGNEILTPRESKHQLQRLKMKRATQVLEI